MRTNASVRTQVTTSAADPLRGLVIGAGVAGVTIAQLLRAAGPHPVLVERTDEEAGRGCMLAPMPMVDPAIRKLGSRGEYLERSVALHR